MFSVLAIASAVLYGAADFLGGLTSRRADTMAVVVFSQTAGLLFVTLLLPVLPAATPTANDWIWGGVAGLMGGIGVALLYRALAVGVMAVVAPVTAVCAVALPVAVAILLGERPGVFGSLGMSLAVVAIVLVSQQSGPDDRSPAASRFRRGLGLALLSGVAIGLFFLALARTNAAAGVWPLVAARIASVTLFAMLIVFSQRALALSRPVLVPVIACGVLDMMANLLYLFATRRGPLTLVVTLASLYPASTVLLARVVLGERLTLRQQIGVVCALVAIILIVQAPV